MSEEKVLTKEIAAQFLVDRNSVKLEEFTKLEDGAAKVLSKSESFDLDLSSLQEISELAAKYLVEFDGVKLYLKGLTNLSENAAKNLAKSAELESGLIIHLNKELSEKVDSYKILTVELIEAIFQGKYLETNNFTKLTEEAAEFLINNDYDFWNGEIQLNGLTEISPSVANSLGQLREKRGNCLKLNGLKFLSDAVAKGLSKYQGHLYLDGLSSLSATAAKYLSLRPAFVLTLSGLSSISNATAEHLSRYRGSLWLRGLSKLTDSAAESLSKHQDFLNLQGLTELSDSVAESLGKHTGKLELSGLPELSDNAAKSLSKRRYDVDLKWYSCSASKEFRMKIASFKVLTKEIAEEFVVKGHSENLGGFGKIEDEAAEILAKYRGQELRLDCLSKISDAAAESLSKHKGNGGRALIYLTGLSELSDAAAESLSKHTGTLFLPSELKSKVKALTKAKFDDLIAKSDNILTKELVQYFESDVIKSLDNIVAIEDEAIEILIQNVRWFFGNIRLKGLKFISEKVAKAFGGLDEGSLDFPSISELSDEAAEGLSFFGGSSLNLDGLQKNSLKAAKSLSGYEGELSLNGLTDIDVEVAESLSSGFLKKLSLNGIKQVSDEALDALKSFDRTLCMDGLNEK